MQFIIEDKNLDEISADLSLVFVINKDLKNKFVKDQSELEFLGFDGEGVAFVQSSKILYVGIKDLTYTSIANGCAKALKSIKKLQISSIKMGSYLTDCDKASFEAVVEGFLLSSYEFNKYKSKKESVNLDKVIICTQEVKDRKIDLDKAKLGIQMGNIIADATNFTKSIVNEIPQVYTPQKMGDDAIKLANELGIKCEIFDESYLQEQGMNAFLAVSRASVHKPRLIHLHYKPKNVKKKVILVGKGLTYDSGGLSLKPSDYMVSMKADKGGASAVMGIIKAATLLELPFEIHAVLGACENMIGSNAYKPDDVLKAKNGVNIEVRNTDAEGRLVLADCLCWAQDNFESDIIIDIATLTGACVVGLGEYTSAVMGQNNELAYQFKNFVKRSGEFYTILEFNSYLEELIQSKIADVCNVSSSRYGGSITAGLFLKRFIKDENLDKWLHLDIAGPAYVEKDWGHNTCGASGAGVRGVTHFLNKLAKEA